MFGIYLIMIKIYLKSTILFILSLKNKSTGSFVQADKITVNSKYGKISGYLVQGGSHTIIIATKDKKVISIIKRKYLMHRYKDGYCIVEFPTRNFT